MPNDSEREEVYRFGDYKLRVQARELSRGDELIPLEPRVFDLLTFLLKNRERVVAKDELYEAIWPGTYASETSLSRCVMKARRAVGDDADRQHTIKTVHARGYRFVAELTESEPFLERDSTPAPEVDPHTRGRSGRSWMFVGAAAVVLVVLAALFLLRGGEEPDATTAGIPRVAVLPIENNTGDPGLAWVEFGLMDMLAGQLQVQSGLLVTASGDVVAALSRRDNAEAVDGDTLSNTAGQLLKQLGATHLVRAVLERPGQLYRLAATVVADDGSLSDMELLGNEPLDLITELRRQIDERVVGARRTTLATRTISDDVFVNEAYARGKDQLLRGDLEQAQTLLQAAVDQEPDNFWARHALATVILNRGNAESAAEMLQTLLEEAKRDDRVFETASSLFLLGNTRLRQNDYTGAEALYREALAGFEALGMPHEQGKALTNLAITAGERRALTEERALLERAAQAFYDAGLESTPGHVLGGLANNALDRGELEDAQRYFEQGLVVFREQGARDQEAVSLFSLSRVAQYRGDFVLARSLAEQSLHIARDVGHRWGEVASLRRVAEAALVAGDLNQAFDAYQDALELSRELGAQSYTASTLAALAGIDRLRGRYDEAAQRLADSARIVEETNDTIGAAWIEVGSGWLALDRGDIDRALASADRVLADEAALSPTLAADGYDLKGRAFAAAGELEQASQAFEKAYEAAERGSNRVRRAQLAAALGLLSLDRQRTELAIGYLGVARDAAPETYQVLVLSAVIAARDGDWDTAVAELDAARQRAGGLWTEEDEQRRLGILAEATEHDRS